MTAFAPSSAQASAFVQGLIDAGLRDAVVCPGSRSQAIALLLAEAERAGLLRLHVRVDERSAGFLALGLARSTGRAVAVVVTSGSAVANLWPAMLEAHHDAIPLLAVTADRPEELIGVGANQATHQPGIFGFTTRAIWALAAPAEPSLAADCADAAEVAVSAVAAACGSRPGPVHVNLSYREPLSGPHPRLRAAEASRAARATAPLIGGRPYEIDASEGTVVVAGAGAGRAAARFAAAAGLPLLPEVVSGARGGDTAIPWYRAALSGGLAARVSRAVVFGRPTLSREITALLAREDVEVVVVDGGLPERYSPRPDAVHVEAVRFAVAGPESWLERWRAAAPPARLDERARIARAVWEACASSGSPLFVAASAMVRVLDEVARPCDVPVFANRGLAGIDGTVSTAIGVAAGSGRRAIALVGDLAFLHDAGGLFVPSGDGPRPEVQFVVVNDGGGSIFRGLEVARADPALYSRVVETPHEVRLAGLCDAYGLDHRVVEADSDRLSAVLLGSGPGVFEVRVAS